MVQILVKQQQLNCCVFFTVLKQLKERTLMLVKDLITLLKEYDDDTIHQTPDIPVPRPSNWQLVVLNTKNVITEDGSTYFGDAD